MPGIDPEPWTPGMIEEFRRRYGEAARGNWQPKPLKIEHLTVDQIRYLLRECVTVVKPGETLVIRTSGLTGSQMHEYQRVLSEMYTEGWMPFKALVVHGDELGVVEASSAEGEAA